MKFECQTHPQDDHVERITDCSTKYGQAPVVCTRVRLVKGRWLKADKLEWLLLWTMSRLVG